MELSTPEVDPSKLHAAVRRAADRSRGAIRTAAHPTLTAILCSSACAPIIAAAVGAGAVPAALLAALGGVGGGALTSAASAVIDRLKREGREEPTEVEISDALAERLDELAAADTAGAAELRREIAAVLAETGAVRIAIESAMESNDEQLLDRILTEFQEQAEAFAEFQALLDDARDEILAHLRRVESRQQSDSLHMIALLKAILIRIPEPGTPKKSAVPMPTGPPYRGLWPYREDQTALFFGRERAVEALLGRASDCMQSSGIVVVTGASGAGKSSLLQAGLIPAIAKGDFPVEGSQEWPRLVMTPGATPLDALATRLASCGGPDAVATRRAIENDPELAHLLVRQRLPESKGDVAARLILVIDQFEELFTLADRTERQTFITAVMSIANGGTAAAGLVVLGLRGDFVDRCATYTELVPVLQDCAFVVGPMTREEMRQTITGPAEAAGLAIDKGLPDDILDDLRSTSDGSGFGPAELPLVSQTMLMLWEQRDAGWLTRRAYSALGGVSDAVRSSAEEVYSQLSEEQREVAAHLFRRMAMVARDGRLVKRAVRRTELVDLGAGCEAVLEAFTDRRLVVVGEATVEIAHEALLRHWDRLRGWMDEDRESLALYSQFAMDAAEWQEYDRDPSFLYQGKRLETVEHHRWYTWRANPEKFPPPEPVALEFLDAARRQHVRKARVRRIVVSGLAMLGAMTLVAASLVLLANHRLTEQQDRHISIQLAETSREVALTDGPLAQLLSAAAWKVSPTDEAWAAMANAVGQAANGRFGTETDARATGMDFSADGSTFVHGNGSGNIILRDTETWESRVLGGEFQGDLSAVELSADGSFMVGFDGWHATVVDTGSGAITAQFPASTVWFPQLALNPDQTRLAVLNGEDSVRIWDLATATVVDTFTVGRRPTALAFNGSGTELVVGSESGRVGFWDLSTAQEVRSKQFDQGIVSIESLPGDDDRLVVCSFECGMLMVADMEFESLDGTLTAAEISPDGQYIAAFHFGENIGVWNSDDLSFVGLVQTDDSVPYFTFGPDSRTLYSQVEGRLVSWDMERMRDVVVHDGEHTTRDLEYSADGTKLLRTGDGPATVWDISEGALETVTEMPGLYGHDTALSPDGRTAASADGEEGATDIVLWDSDSGDELRTLKGHTGFITGLDFNGDGSMLASSSSHTVPGFEGDGDPNAMSEVRIWDAATGDVVASFRDGDGFAPMDVDFRPDGRAVAVLDESGAVSEWDAASGALLRRLTPDVDQAIELAYSPDGANLGVGAANGLVLWGDDSEDPIVHPSGLTTGSVHQFAFSPDGTMVAQSVWHPFDGSSGVVIRDLERDQILTTIPIWTLATEVAFSSDSRTLAVVAGGEEVNSLYFYDLGFLDDPYAAVCEQAGRQLTAEEWQSYMPGLPIGSIDICD